MASQLAVKKLRPMSSSFLPVSQHRPRELLALRIQQGIVTVQSIQYVCNLKEYCINPVVIYQLEL